MRYLPMIFGFLFTSCTCSEPTNKKTTEELLNGTWNVEGTTNKYNGSSVEVEGKLTFAPLRTFKGVFSFNFLENENKMLILAYHVDGKWKFEEDGRWVIDYESSKCDCTFRGADKRLVADAKKNPLFCKNGKFIEPKGESKSFSDEDYEIGEDKIVMKYKNYTEGFDLNIILTKVKN